MNQTKKRLSIIKLAISITDIETIQLQILKLTPMKTDVKIQEILSLLQAGNYAQSQALITDYIDNHTEEILQRTSQKEEPTVSAEEEAVIDEFQLFVTSTNTVNKPAEIDINDFAAIKPKITKDKPSIDFDSLLNLDVNDILTDNINITKKQEETFFKEEKKDFLDISNIPKDTFFDTTAEKKPTPTIQVDNNEEDASIELKEKNTPQYYDPILDIAQKHIDMKYKYPPIQNIDEKFDTVDSLLNKIANEGYSEAEIEEQINLIKELIENSKYTEAAQLLLVCAATESNFARFMLARELYTGSVLTKNIPEAFTLMNNLAKKDYPEALCDLGQLYENGIGTTADIIKAEELYKEAVNLGIKRAKKHYSRLKKLNNGFFK